MIVNGRFPFSGLLWIVVVSSMVRAGSLNQRTKISIIKTNEVRTLDNGISMPAGINMPGGNFDQINKHASWKITL